MTQANKPNTFSNDTNADATQVNANFDEIYSKYNEHDVASSNIHGVGGSSIASKEFVNEVLPAGIITMWSGAITDIPDTWTLCDGSNGAPDLRDRFVVGAGNTYAPESVGGESEVTLTESQLPVHTHSNDFSVNNDTHSHTGDTTNQGGHDHLRHNDSSGNYIAGGSTAYALHAHSRGENQHTRGAHGHSLNIGDDTHSHTLSGSISSTGGGESHENKPPYFALAYIMKL